MLASGGALVGRGGLGWLLRMLFRVLIWHLIIQTVGGFMGRYTHLPALVNVIILVLLIVGVRFAVRHLPRRRA